MNSGNNLDWLIIAAEKNMYAHALEAHTNMITIPNNIKPVSLCQD